MKVLEALREDFWDVADLLTIPDGRRELTRLDPLLFAYVYLRHHLEAPDGSTTVSPFHLDLVDYALGWARPIGDRKEHRACFIAPRGSGKSTWIFLLLPMWAAAHGHRKFVAAFSNSDTQAMTHLHTFKMELQNNDLLKADFPELCEGKKVTGTTRELLNNRNQIMQANDFIFMAKGADAASHGMKLGSKRPDVLLFDDIEPGESNYSAYIAAQRKETLQSDLFPLNEWAVVAIVGTTTMPNSLIDQMRKVANAEADWEEPEAEANDDPIEFRERLEPELRWVLDENIKVHYWPAIFEVDGIECSVWPEKWPMESLNLDRGTRAFQKNYMNKPVSADGGFWGDGDIDIDQPEFYRRTLISVDPAVTTKKSSDYTGIAVVSQGSDNLLYVRHAEQVKLPGHELNVHVSNLVERFGAGMVIVETNQGGDLWKQVFNGLPCKFQSIRATEKKEVRAERAFNFYEKKAVKHTAHFHVAEEQMLAFPHVVHDDVVDAIVTGVLAFKKARSGVSVTHRKYMEV